MNPLSSSIFIRPRAAPKALRRADCVCKDARHRTHSSGFSLVELAVVMVIIVVTAAIAIPRYSSSLGRYRVDTAARRLAADIALAQSKARSTGRFRNVIFRDAANTYVLFEEAALDPSSTRFRVDLSASPFQVSMDTIWVSDSGNKLTFDGFGQPAQGLSVKLSAAGHTRTVTVDQTSGAISEATP